MKLLIEIKNLALLASIVIILLATQACRCLICDNHQEPNPEFNLGQKVNSPYDDFAPMLLNDNQLIFTSNKEAISGYISDENFYGEDLFIASNEDSIWQKANLFESPTSTAFNEGTISRNTLNNNNFTIISRSHHPDGVGGSDLYLAKFDGKNFSDLKNLGDKFNTENWESHPTLSDDGTILIFASNRDGGYGGSDLYISYKENNNWSSPLNLGAVINTPNDELSPYLTTGKNTILFYASGNKGLDIYYNYSNGENSWGEKKLLDANVNTDFNDAFPCVPSNMKSIYFCSDRPGGCGGFDLYSAPLNLEEPCPDVKGKVIDQETLEPLLASATISISKVNNKETFIESNTFLPNSEYDANQLCAGEYIFHISAPGYISKDTLINVNLANTNFIHALLPKPPLQPKKVFDLREYNIPFFVTGYYKLNTKDNLNILRRRVNTDLAKATYIENPGRKYDRYSEMIESIFKDSIYTFVTDSLLPFFSNIEDEYLEFEVFGYTDPRTLNSTYIEEDITFNQIKVRNNSAINNQVLSNLRAFYTMQYLDEMLSKNSSYADLKNKELVKYQIKGMGVDTKKKATEEEIDFDARRRVQIKIWQRPLK